MPEFANLRAPPDPRTALHRYSHSACRRQRGMAWPRPFTGVVTDASAPKVSGANVVLISHGNPGFLGHIRRRWQLSNLSGAYRPASYLVVSAKSFRQN